MVLPPPPAAPSKPRLIIEYVTPKSIRPRERNPRMHSDAQIGKLMEAIKELGFVAPILIGNDGEVICGHGRLEAAKRLRLVEIPVIRLSHLSPAQIRALVIADNQLAALSTWDEDILKLELQDLVFDESIDFSPTITGFEAAAIDAIVFGTDFADQGGDPADEFAAIAPKPAAITRIGDIWRAGGLTLVCGDALSAATYAAVLSGERAAMALTDPPWNLPINGHVSGKGKTRHREFVQASGEMSDAEFTDFLRTFCQRLKDHVSARALLYVFMDGAHLFNLMSAARSARLIQKTLCTWAKTNAGMGSLYRSQTEQVVVFKASDEPHTNNVQLGRFGRNRTTLWTYPGANSFGRNRDAALAQHPTVKPVAMLVDAILDATKQNELVLDPFAGSGSTLIAAHRVGRRAAGIELDPLYVDGALARISAVTGLDFIRARDGACWSDLIASEDQT